jgi:hypothetical protein
MYKNKAITWTVDPTLDDIYETLRKQHYLKEGHRLYKNYSKDHLTEVSAKTIYWGNSGEPEIVCSILQRPCWPDKTYRILNRLWKPKMMTGPIFDISEGFAKVLEDQIGWCHLRQAEGVFMSRQGDGNWQKWAGEKLGAMTGLKFQLPRDKFLTCNNEQDESCWQRIIYYGNPDIVKHWKNIPNTEKHGLRRLDITDLDALKDLVSTKAVVKDTLPEDLAHALTYRARWLEGMTKHYLNHNDTHYLYGWYDDGKLISCMGWRCDLPAPWNDGWVVGNLKSRPGYTVKSNGMLQLWNKMFEVCEGLGLKRWHMVIPQSNSRRYQAVADRYFSSIDSSYDYDWSIIVPPNTRPDIDWIWGSMGRILLNTEIRVRTGTKKWEHLVPKTYNWNNKNA